MKKIVDLSRYNLNQQLIGPDNGLRYDYAVIAALVDAVILKATDPEVPGGEDRTHAIAFAGFREVGLPVGEYHFYDPSCSPVENARVFMTHSKRGFLDALDVEDQENATLSGLTMGVVNTGREFAQRSGRKPWLYSNLDYLDNRLLDAVGIADAFAGLWVAWPAPNAQTFPKPRRYAKEFVGIWQKSWVWPLAGQFRRTGVDYNEWQWGDEAWAKLVGGLPKWDGMTEEGRWELMRKLALTHNLAS